MTEVSKVGSTITKSLKQENLPPLFWILVLHIVVLTILIQGGDFSLAAIKAASERLDKFLPTLIALPLMTVINGLFSSQMKARVIFWRWHNPLPGSLAFTKYGPQDIRIDMKSLQNKLGELPTEPREQNFLWFKIYSEIKNETIIRDAHKQFLFCRDYASTILLLLIATAPIAYMQLPEIKTSLAYIMLLIVQYFLAMIAARRYGIALVTNVLSIQAVGTTR